MKLKYLLFAIFSLLTTGLCACGSSGSDGLNGGIAVTATATGSVINAVATYTHPTETNLIGVPIQFSFLIGNQTFDLGSYSTNNSGSVGVAFKPAAFAGTQTITVIARTANLTNFSSLNMTGTSLAVTPPPALSLTTDAAGGTPVPFVIPSTAAFVTITDPFTNQLSGHPITISASFVSNNPSDTLVPPSVTTTSSAGTAPFPSASGTLVAPTAVGAVETMTITWTVTDTVTGQTGTGITSVTLTKTS